MKTNALFLAAALGGLAPWFATAATDPLPAVVALSAAPTTAPTTAATPAATTAAAASGYTDGELKKIDAEQGKITLKHGPIDNLGMPGMTMVFRADVALLSNFKPGDLVKFKADRVDGAFKVTELVAR